MTCKHCHQRKPLNRFGSCAECFEKIKDKAREIFNNPESNLKV